MEVGPEVPAMRLPLRTLSCCTSAPEFTDTAVGFAQQCSQEVLLFLVLSEAAALLSTRLASPFAESCHT